MVMRLLTITLVSFVVAYVSSYWHDPKHKIAEDNTIFSWLVFGFTFVFVLFQAVQFGTTAELPIRTSGLMKNPNMAGFILLTLSALFVYTRNDSRQQMIACGIFFSSPRAFICCFVVYSMLVGFKRMRWFWGTLAIILILCQTPFASQGSKVSADRVILTPIVVFEYLGGSRVFKKWYQEIFIGDDLRRLMLSENGRVNIEERLADGVSDNAYFSYWNLLGPFWFTMWLTVILFPLYYRPWGLLEKYYFVALLSGFSMQIFILNPSWQILAVTYGLLLRRRT